MHQAAPCELVEQHADQPARPCPRPTIPFVRRLVETRLPVDLRLTLAPLRLAGPRDPCVAIGPVGVWRASRWPSGPATTLLRSLSPTTVEVEAWGPGAAEALDGAPALVGADDTDGGLLTTDDTVVRAMARSRPGLRIGRTGNVLEAVTPTIIAQKVPGHLAARSFVAMVRAHGEPAPAPDVDGAPRLLLPPTADWLAAQPSWMWHRWGVERRRASTVARAVRSTARPRHRPRGRPVDRGPRGRGRLR